MMNTAIRTVRSPRFMKSAAAASLAALALIATGAATTSAPQQREILERERGSDWTLRVNITIRAGQEIDPRTRMPVSRGPLQVDTAAVVFPIPYETASHFTWPDAGGELKVANHVVDDRPQWLTGYHSGVRLGKWDLVDWEGQRISLSVEIPVTSFNTRFDEDTANHLDWPETWPAEAQSTFEPQLFVDMGTEGPYEMEPVKKLVEQWTRGQDPKNVKPVVLARYFAGEVWRMVQPTGNGLVMNRQGELEGLDLQGTPETVRRGRGTEFDMVCLLAAVYREAGLPARTVIGFDLGGKRDVNPILGRTGSASLRSWVEFAIVDQRGDLIWVPVDIVRMRKSSSRPPNTSTWRWFGTHNELENVIPFAFHFHPPTDVVGHGSPAFWGWMVTPKPPEHVVQAIRFDAIRTPRQPSRERPSGPERR